MRRLLHEIRNRVRFLFGFNRKQRELDEEIDFHLQEAIDELVESGVSPEEARLRALREFGHANSVLEDCRDSWGTRVVMDLIRDVRYSVRSLWKSKGFSFAVVATLALCIGVNTTVLSALYSLVLKPLPVENPERLVRLFNVKENRNSNFKHSGSSSGQYLDLRERTDLFEGSAFTWTLNKLVDSGSSVRRVKTLSVTADYFELMNAKPVLGRFFSPEEMDRGAAKTVVLSQSVWESEYESNPKVIGKEIRVDDNVIHTIIGVASRSLGAFDFEIKYIFPHDIVYDSSRDVASNRYARNSNDLWLRLKPGVSREAALGQIRAIERRWYEEIANNEGRRNYETYDGNVQFEIADPLEGSLYLLESSSLLILLVGCFNVMTLSLSRVNHKRHELSIRNALGSGKSRLRRLMLVESAFLIGAAAAAGVILAWGGLYLINGYLSAMSPSSMPVGLDLNVVATAFAATVGIVSVIGLFPLEILWKTGLLRRVDGSQRSSSAGGLSRTVSNCMVVGQIAVAFVMLIGGGLLFRSFQNVLNVDPGFEATQVVQGRLDFSTVYTFYKNRADGAVLKRRIHEAMKGIPGVESVSFSVIQMFSNDLRAADQPSIVRGEEFDPSQVSITYLVSPEFFTTMGIPILEGRSFNAGDIQYTAIVDELFARRYFGDRSPVGAEIHGSHKGPGPKQRWHRIVGVAGRANLRGLEQWDGVPIIYSNEPIEFGDLEYTILLRVSRPAEGVVRDMRAKIHEIDPRLPLSYAGPLDEALDEMLLSRKGITLLLVSFAALALFLSLTGVYAVLAYDVSQRGREIGIRKALGSSRQRIHSMILKTGLAKTFTGLGLGIVGALFLSRFLESFLFGVARLDTATYVGSVSLFVFAALLACYLPARRAANVDPLETMAAE